jgi:N utilization substance protein B
LQEPFQEEIPYYLKNFFDKRKEEDIDIDYLIKIGATFPQYTTTIKDIVNRYTATFSYEQMDVVDQAIFLLGYTEHITLATPKEILLNEMIELAKRYSDDGAPKLINGIMDKIIS